jgi:hypothetical protein
VAVLHGMPEVPEPARLPPPVADFLLANRSAWLAPANDGATLYHDDFSWCFRGYQSEDVGGVGVATGRASPEHREEPGLVPPVQPPLPLHRHAPPHLPRSRRIAEHLAPAGSAQRL